MVRQTQVWALGRCCGLVTVWRLDWGVQGWEPGRRLQAPALLAPGPDSPILQMLPSQALLCPAPCIPSCGRRILDPGGSHPEASPRGWE